MAASPGSHAATVRVPIPIASRPNPTSITRRPPNRITSVDDSALIETVPRNCTVKARPISASDTSQRCDSAPSTGPSSVVAMPAMKKPTCKSGRDGGVVSGRTGIVDRKRFHSLLLRHYRACGMLQNASILILYGFIVLPVAVTVAATAIGLAGRRCRGVCAAADDQAADQVCARRRRMAGAHDLGRRKRRAENSSTGGRRP